MATKHVRGVFWNTAYNQKCMLPGWNKGIFIKGTWVGILHKLLPANKMNNRCHYKQTVYWSGMGTNPSSSAWLIREHSSGDSTCISNISLLTTCYKLHANSTSIYITIKRKWLNRKVILINGLSCITKTSGPKYHSSKRLQPKCQDSELWYFVLVLWPRNWMFWFVG